jgi:PAS domain S-box-containing protein
MKANDPRRRFASHRFSEFLKTVELMAAGNTRMRLPISADHDELDAIAHAINVLVGELAWATARAIEAQEAAAKKRSDQAARENEERFRRAIADAPVMIWMAGVDKRCTDVNQKWLAFTGRSIDAERGDGWVDGVHPDDVQRCVTLYSDAFDRREPFTIEYRLRRYDGVYRWVVDSGIPRFDADGDFLGYIGSAVDITDQKVAQATLSSLSGRLMEAQEQERSWIARELHDDVGQRTAALTMQVHFLIESFAKGSLNRHQVESLYAQMRELVTRVQAISRRLHPAVLDYDGLSTAASRLCRDLSMQHGVEIAFHAEDVPSDLPNDIALALFRVLQEGLNNAIKHSGGRQFIVTLIGSTGDVQLQVIDTGVGFDVEHARRHGLGLISMSERLRFVNGEVSIDSQPGGGTTLRACVPFRTATARSPT